MRFFRQGTNIGLRAKLILLIESLVILLVLATGIITTMREKQALENELEKRGLALSANIAGFVVRPLINKDLPTLRRFVSHSMGQDYVRYVIILDPDGKVVMHNDLAQVGKIYDDGPTKSSSGSDELGRAHPHISKVGELYCDIFTPIQLSGVRVGTVALGYSYAAVEKQIATAHQQVFVIGLAMTLIGAVAAYLLATFISTPVRCITMAVEKVADGEPYFPLKIKRRDEIGILANSFDQMAEDLEKHRKHLEELVQERTTDLKRVNERLRQEISDRREAEEALRQSEKHYRETFDAMTDWILAVDSDLRIVLFNDAFVQINKELGLTTDVIGRTPMEIFPFLSHTLVYEYRWILENKKVLITQETTKVGNREFVTESRKIPLLKDGRLSKVVSVIRDITDRKRAEEQIEASLKEKEVLLREIHHRVKNNMQVIASLLKMQCRGVKDDRVRALLEESQNRVNAMVLVQELLYQSDSLAEIDLKTYVEELVGSIFTGCRLGGDVTWKSEVEAVTLSIDQAAPLGLALSEIMTNSLKHGFPQGGPGKITIRSRLLENGQVELVIRDNGSGMPERIDIRNTETLGLRLVTGLVENQLGGMVELSRKKGTQFTIRFPRKAA